MKMQLSIGILLAMLALAVPQAAAKPLPHGDVRAQVHEIVSPASSHNNGQSGYNTDLFIDHVKSIKYDVFGIFAATGVLGALQWDWGSSKFRFNSEGFFGKNTISGGMDKAGHIYSAALYSDYFYDRIINSAANNQQAAITSTILSGGIMTMIEIADGFSGDHGFSGEDMAMNAIGISFSYLRNTIPGMRDLVDFRLEYVPSGNVKGFRPHTDYSGQKYLLAFKLAGLAELEDSPFRFLELQAGYYARGFTRKEKLKGKRKRRRLYVGIGINLSQLLLGKRKSGDRRLKRWGRFALEHVQVPYTYVGTSNTF